MENFLKRGFKGQNKDKILIYILFISVFLPYHITAVALIFSFLYVLIAGKTPKNFYANGGFWAILFTVYTVIIGAINRNYLGIACSAAFFMLIMISNYAREHFDKNMFEKCLSICCLCGFLCAVLSCFEYFYYNFFIHTDKTHRCQLYFFNSNYLATVLATVIIICGYKIISKNPKYILYHIVSIFCAVGLYFTGSMFVWVEVLIGLSSLFLFMRKHQMLSILLLLAGTACIIIYCMPMLVPRLGESNITTDNRVIIWITSIKQIIKNPVFGGGFLTYFNIFKNYPGSYPTTHSHNIFLEPILSFGIIGTVILLVYLLYFYKRVITCHNAQNQIKITALILSLTCAILIHGTTDLTFMWIQTGLLYCLIMGGLGVEERMLKL